MARIFVTHTPQMRKNYYSDKALDGLRALGEVALNPGSRALNTQELIEAAHGYEFIVSDRQTPGDGELFRRLPDLVAFSRCAVDIRNVDVAAASECGILVTQASAGFIAAVAEWTIGVLIDLSRHISDSANRYHADEIAAPVMGRELKGSTIGVVGYGQIGRHVCELALALGMRVVVTTPVTDVTHPPLIRLRLEDLLATSDYVVCLAIANAETANMFNADAFARMKPTAFFVNASRGELVDEIALERALDQGLIAGCGPGSRPDAHTTARASSEGDRHAARRWPYAAGR